MSEESCMETPVEDQGLRAIGSPKIHLQISLPKQKLRDLGIIYYMFAILVLYIIYMAQKFRKRPASAPSSNCVSQFAFTKFALASIFFWIGDCTAMRKSAHGRKTTMQTFEPEKKLRTGTSSHVC